MVIYVHSGIFHADDAMATAIALRVYPDAKIRRVRVVPEDRGDALVLDVGGVYDPSHGQFDHHQRGGSDDGRAATGKVWAQMGPQICGSEQIASRVYDMLLASIDRNDIGVKDCAPIEGMRHLSASAFVSMMNAEDATSPEQDVAFGRAVQACSNALAGAITNAGHWIRMRDIVLTINPREAIFIPEPGEWQEHVLADDRFAETMYVAFPSDRGGFLLQCVPDKIGSFGTRKSLPQAWAGLRGEQLASLVGIQAGPEVFCHPGRFIAGAVTLEDCQALAEYAIAA